MKFSEYPTYEYPKNIICDSCDYIIPNLSEPCPICSHKNKVRIYSNKQIDIRQLSKEDRARLSSILWYRRNIERERTKCRDRMRVKRGYPQLSKTLN